MLDTANEDQNPNTDANPEELERAFWAMHQASRQGPAPGFERRMGHVQAIEHMLMKHKKDWLAAVSSDFDGRSEHETLLTEFLVVMNAVKHTRKHLRDWMRARRRNPGLLFQPGRARVFYQPLGVIGIIGPWNYPIQLTLLPLLGALSAGNRVMLKPSEFTPKTSALLADLVSKYFNPQEVFVSTGGAELAANFSRLPFDHLFFTGSTSIGQKVMAAAAQNLTPVTLELGGKSPAIIHEQFNLDTAAERIVRGKLINSGQTCIAPDYVMVPQRHQEAFVQAIQAQVAKMYPSYVNNPDYTSIISQRHRDRLERLVTDAREAGTEVIEVNPSGEAFDGNTRKLPLRLLINPSDDLEVMRDEIFGPVLPIKTYDQLDDAIRYVNDHPRPLALYLFSDNDKVQERVLEQTVSGGVTINDTLLHCAVEDLPFGGVGPSGMGRYHGEDSFKVFSHEKGVYFQTKVNGGVLASPPFGGAVEALLKIFVR